MRTTILYAVGALFFVGLVAATEPGVQTESRRAVKIFSVWFPNAGEQVELEKEINDWLKDVGKNYRIEQWLQSESACSGHTYSRHVTVTVVYSFTPDAPAQPDQPEPKP